MACGSRSDGMAVFMTADHLRNAVESQHHCHAHFVQTVPVHEEFQGQTVWDGVVHVFDIEDRPKATRAYAWYSAIGGSDKRRFFAVLQLGAIRSPLDAVGAAIVAEHRTARGAGDSNPQPPDYKSDAPSN